MWILKILDKFLTCNSYAENCQNRQIIAGIVRNPIITIILPIKNFKNCSGIVKIISRIEKKLLESRFRNTYVVSKACLVMSNLRPFSTVVHVCSQQNMMKLGQSKKINREKLNKSRKV